MFICYLFTTRSISLKLVSLKYRAKPNFWRILSVDESARLMNWLIRDSERFSPVPSLPLLSYFYHLPWAFECSFLISAEKLHICRHKHENCRLFGVSRYGKKSTSPKQSTCQSRFNAPFSFLISDIQEYLASLEEVQTLFLLHLLLYLKPFCRQFKAESRWCRYGRKS